MWSSGSRWASKSEIQSEGSVNSNATLLFSSKIVDAVILQEPHIVKGGHDGINFTEVSLSAL